MSTTTIGRGPIKLLFIQSREYCTAIIIITFIANILKAFSYTSIVLIMYVCGEEGECTTHNVTMYIIKGPGWIQMLYNTLSHLIVTTTFDSSYFVLILQRRKLRF